MGAKKNYIRPKILVEEWKFYKETNNSRWGHRVYEVSNFGRLKVNGELIEFDDSKPGYYGIAGAYLHKIVAELFIPNPENKSHVDHIDTNKHNNVYWNLRWCTQKENCNNPLTRKHNSEAQNIPEVKQKRSESLQTALNKPEIKQKRSESQKVAQNKPEVNQKRSESLKESWANIEVKQKRSEAMNRPETKQKISESSKDRTWINKNNIRKFIKTDQLSLFLNKGWNLGRK